MFPGHLLRSSPPPITALRWLEDEGDLKMKDSIYQFYTAAIGHTSLDLLGFSRSGTGSGFVKMLRSQMKVLVVALCSSVLALHVSSAPQMDELTETLQAELIGDKDLTGLLLLRFMSELMASRGEEMQEEEDERGGRQRLMRRHVRFTHRERKAGCRNFFWKTFTSC
ncbi:LOW QUALITY PROTEIN: somatostatin-1-like [Poeciliopsis prolifica]|uniref:LOW QUALITY PROTEIN: somatostatin-1-like n=1 Tax=Poeciliopsis prolifica TaxID=188132 RepID=UPI0024145DA4|nr:LOW QUALITY PROTEIN: somatostatin-1-like [Poeciliopsis prolifica]